MAQTKRQELEEALQGLGFIRQPAELLESRKDYTIWKHPESKTSYFLVGISGGFRQAHKEPTQKHIPITKSVGVSPNTILNMWRSEKARNDELGQTQCPGCSKLVQNVLVQDSSGGSPHLVLDKHECVPNVTCPNSGQLVRRETVSLENPPKGVISEADLDGHLDRQGHVQEAM